MSPLDAQLAARAALVDQVRAALVRALHLEIDPADLDPNTALFGTGLGLDSIDTLEFVLQLEETFGIDARQVEGDQYTLRNINTVADLIERVQGGRP